MSHRIDISRASTMLPELVHSLGEDDEIILVQDGQPIGRVTRATANTVSVRGCWKGKVHVLDESEEGIAEMFEGGET